MAGREPVAWYSGGYYDEPSDPLADPAYVARTYPTPYPAARSRGEFGPSERRGACGLVAGRFLPLHRGHEYLIEFARASVHRLVVAIFCRDDDPVPFHVRANWIVEAHPGVEVREVRPAQAAREVSTAPAFAIAFADAIRALDGVRPSHLFASELAYGACAKVLGCTFVPVDPTRIAVPCSGTAIRANVMEHFHHVAPSARAHLARRVAIVGAESTGKSTLAARLRDQFSATLVPEYLRALAAADGEITSGHVQLAARSQLASEDALVRQVAGGVGGGLLVCDTELRTVAMWSQRLFFGDQPAWIAEAAAARPYDLYLLCHPDLPYVGPPSHDHPADRRTFHDELAKALAPMGDRVVHVVGERDERWRIACDAVIGLFSPTALLSARGLVMI